MRVAMAGPLAARSTDGSSEKDGLKDSRRGNACAVAGYVVFLSHCSRDTWIANAIAEKIQTQGAAVWLDVHELSGGDLIPVKVLEGVDACDEAIVLLSPFSLNSQWVLFEMGVVYGQRKRLTPILDHIDHTAIPVLPSIRGIDLNQLDQALLPELTQRIAEKARKARGKK